MIETCFLHAPIRIKKMVGFRTFNGFGTQNRWEPLRDPLL